MDPSAHTEWWRAVSTPTRGNPSEAFSAAEPTHPDSDVPFWALMAFTFILLIAPQFVFPALAPLRIALLTAVLAVMTHLLHRFVHRQPFMRFTREMWITACLAGWAILTLPFSYWPGGSVSFLLEVHFKTLVVFWLLSNLVNTLVRIRLIVWGLTLMAVPLAATALSNFLSGVFVQAGHGVTRIVGYDAPLTGNPNDLALMLNLILPLTVALFLGSQRRAVRAVLAAIICLDVIAIIATFSRAGFLTLAVTFGTYLWMLRKRPERSWAWLALVLALAVVPLVPSSYVDRLSTITEIEADPTGSAQARWRDTTAAMKVVLRDPIIGAGIGMNALALNDARGAAWTKIHNVYLEYAVELGIPGLILFILLFKACLTRTRDVQRLSADEPALAELFYVAEGIRVSLIAFAVAALFYPVAYHFYFYYIAGLAVAAHMVWEAEASSLTHGSTSVQSATRRAR